MLVSFVVPTYRRPEALRQTLDALFSLDHPTTDYEVIVVDDGSGDETPEVVSSLSGGHANLRLLSQANAGVATARNRGAQAAHGELLIFVDDDIIVFPDHLTGHLRAREAHGDCLVNGHWEFSPETMAALQQTPFGRYRIEIEDWVKGGIAKAPLPDGRLHPDGVTAANLSISATTFHSLGGFDPSFPFAGCEDQEFSYRAREAGCTFIYDPAIRLLHNDGRVSLEQFGERQRRGAITAVHLAARHPEDHVDRALLVENAPLHRRDPPLRMLKKSAKYLVASPAGLATASALARALEPVAPDSALLRRLYRITLGAYIFRGIQDGLRQLPQVRAAVAAAVDAGAR
jgi:GT2 family glycosyltransferase